MDTVDPHDDTLAGGWGVFDGLDLQVGNVFGIIQILAQVNYKTLLSFLYIEVKQLI